MHEGRFDEKTASRRALLLGLAATAAVPLIGCDREPALPAVVTADGVSRVEPPDGAPMGTAVDGFTTFGHKLLTAVAKPGENFVASPLSLAVAFSMLRAGAAGKAASELDALLGFPSSGRDAAFNAITGQLATVDVPPRAAKKARDGSQPPPAPVVSIGNALFPKQGFAIGPDFLRTLAEQYGAGVRPVDFTSPEALKLINAWADKQTAGRIKQVFDQLDPQTLLVLANAVYFKADWQVYFEVFQQPFTKADGTVIKTPALQRSRKVRYAETGGVAAVELPYASGPYAMWLMLPPRGGQPEDALTPAAMVRLRAALTETQVDVSVPKWDFATSIDLKEVLIGMGLTALFDDGADFSGIAPGLFVSQAIHRANISVDEWGTEAAGITSFGMLSSGPPPAQARFIADRPYAFAIVGGDDRIPMFVGRVSDPTAP